MIKRILYILLSFLLLSGFTCSQTDGISLTSIKGEYVNVSSFKGKVVVVSWWATWCKPCIQELKFLNRMAKKYPKDLVVVAISVDSPNTSSAVGSTVHTRRLDNITVLLDPVGSTNPLGQLPYSIYINRAGLQCSEHSGFVAGDESSIEEKIVKLIKEGKK